MRILGLDPGSLHTGFGVVERRGSRVHAIASGRISPPRGQTLALRLAHLSRELQGIIEQLEPQAAALESLFHGVNPRSLIVLAQARGALLVTLALQGITCREYSPAEVKSALTGHGRADKQQVQRMVRLALGLGDEPLSVDASDALAVAVCYAQRYRLDALVPTRNGKERAR